MEYRGKKKKKKRDWVVWRRKRETNGARGRGESAIGRRAIALFIR